MTKDEFQKAVDDVITDCIRNDYSFGSYAYKVAEAVWPLLKAAEKERNALRAKIAEMEKQEPVWFIDERGEPKRYHKSKADYCKYGGLDLLYALPGAKGEKK